MSKKTLEQLRDEMNDPKLPIADRRCSVVEYRARTIKFCYVCGKEIFTYHTISFTDGKGKDWKRPICGECQRNTEDASFGMEVPYDP